MGSKLKAWSSASSQEEPVCEVVWLVGRSRTSFGKRSRGVVVEAGHNYTTPAACVGATRQLVLFG